MTPVVVSQCVNDFFDTPAAAIGAHNFDTSFDRTLQPPDVDEVYDPPTDVSANAGLDSFLLPSQSPDVMTQQCMFPAVVARIYKNVCLVVERRSSSSALEAVESCE